MPKSESGTQMTSKQVKATLLKRFTFFNGFVGAVHEAANLNSADVIAVKHGGKIQEFEIKCSRADLIGELRCARVAFGLDEISKYLKRGVQQNLINDGVERTPDQVEAIKQYGHGLSKTKLTKHKLYLSDEGRTPPKQYGWSPAKPFVPHQFYWCIPHELLAICRELNDGLPYGIYVYDMPQSSKYYQKFIVKPARSLKHQGDRVYFELFNRACTLWGEDRGSVEYLKKQVAELEKQLSRKVSV